MLAGSLKPMLNLHLEGPPAQGMVLGYPIGIKKMRLLGCLQAVLCQADS